MGGGKRRPTKFSGGRASAASGDLPVRRKRGPPAKGANAFGYSSSDDPTCPIHLSTSTIVAFVDPTPSSDPVTDVPSYNYDPAIAGCLGLGFREEENEDDQLEEEEEEERVEQYESEGKGEGFLSIGGVRVYTEDCSSPEDDVGSESGDSTGSDSSEEEEGEGQSSDQSSSDVDGDEDDDSEIDEEMVDDYIEGIGGSSEVMKSGFLAKKNIEEEYLGFESTSDDEDGDKLGAIEMMNFSQAYGMMMKKKTRKGRVSSPMVDIGLSAAMDDLMFAKDPRTISGRMTKTKALSQLSRSWPREGQRSKDYYSVSGGKKKQHKELIAVKRRQRMINRGADLEQINLKLRQLVIDKVDMFSFYPIHSRDCSQVRRLASIYHLQSCCQGSGKKRFVTVTRTMQTCLPSPYDKLRLDKILGEGVDVDNANMRSPHTQPRSRVKREKKLSLHQSAPPKLSKSGDASVRKKRSEKKVSALYSERPVSFISSGVMEVDSALEKAVLDPNNTVPNEKTTDAGSSRVGAFEMHTKGFGSKMMAKMGFVEGGGLGKAGQGIALPIEAIQRPKSLGLGVEFDEVNKDSMAGAGSIGAGSIGAFEKHTNGCRPKSLGRGRKSDEAEKDSRAGSGGIGTFEKHTKGFGSKMMARMGFVPGTGLGRDAQGIVNPLTAVRRAKARGLGAKS